MVGFLVLLSVLVVHVGRVASEDVVAAPVVEAATAAAAANLAAAQAASAANLANSAAAAAAQRANLPPAEKVAPDGAALPVIATGGSGNGSAVNVAAAANVAAANLAAANAAKAASAATSAAVEAARHAGLAANLGVPHANAVAASIAASNAAKAATEANTAAAAAAHHAGQASAAAETAAPGNGAAEAAAANMAAVAAAKAANAANSAAAAAAHHANVGVHGKAKGQGPAAATAAAATAQAAANEANKAAAVAAHHAVEASVAAAVVPPPAKAAIPLGGPETVMRSELTHPAPASFGPTKEPLPRMAWLRPYMPGLARILAGVSFAAIVKVLCMMGNILVQVSPYPQVRRWEVRGCTGEADAAPYVSIAFGGWQWCFYGMFAWLLTKRSGFLILVHSNILGAVLGTYYTVTFYRHCRLEPALHKLTGYLSAVTALALLQMCAMMVLPAERALFLVGLISSFCSFVGALSMLVTVPLVIRTGDSRSIPGPLVLANLGSSLVWCLCGWMLADPLVTGPNVVSALASVVCLYLKFRFPSYEKNFEDFFGASCGRQALNQAPAADCPEPPGAAAAPPPLGAPTPAPKVAGAAAGPPPTEFTPLARAARAIASRTAAVAAAAAAAAASAAAPSEPEPAAAPPPAAAPVGAAAAGAVRSPGAAAVGVGGTCDGTGGTF